MPKKLHKSTTKNIMKEVTELQVSDSAITFLNTRIEGWIKEITRKAEKILKETNAVRKAQGQREKKRLGELEIKEVIGWE